MSLQHFTATLLFSTYMNRVRDAPIGALHHCVFVNGQMLHALHGVPAAIILTNPQGARPCEQPVIMQTNDGLDISISTDLTSLTMDQEHYGIQFITDRGLQPALSPDFVNGEPGPFTVLGIVSSATDFTPLYASRLTSAAALDIFSSTYTACK